MLRNIDLLKVSDGKLYGINDMVKAGCNGCEGCSACCRGMGSSIVLDPLDVHRICNGLGKSPKLLLSESLELNVADGIILPNLRMSGPRESCYFLNEKGRCSIHSVRPGICRIFPLGRFYENGSFRYFLQVHECPKPNKAKVKIRKWIDTEDCKRYEKYICDWHYYLKKLQEYAMTTDDADKIRSLSMHILQDFYLLPFGCEQDFYEQFYLRLEKSRKYTATYL